MKTEIFSSMYWGDALPVLGLIKKIHVASVVVGENRAQALSESTLKSPNDFLVDFIGTHGTIYLDPIVLVALRFEYLIGSL